MHSPLRAMLGFAAMLREETHGKLSPEAEDYLRRITTAARRLDGLIQDVLTYSKVVRTQLHLVPIVPESLIREIIESCPNLQSDQATIQIEPGIPAVAANPAALTQIFSNLLGNAVKFVAPGVRPQVSIWAEPAAVDHSPFVRIFVKDNGIGIRRDDQKDLFQMFHRLHPEREYEGTGVGLAIVRKAAERMGGKVGVVSEFGKGSTFWIELRRA